VTILNVWLHPSRPLARVAVDSIAQDDGVNVERAKIHVHTFPALVVAGRGSAVWPWGAADAIHRHGARDLDHAEEIIDQQLPEMAERFTAAARATPGGDGCVRSRSVLLLVGWSPSAQRMTAVRWEGENGVFERGYLSSMYVAPHDESIAPLRVEWPNLLEVETLARAQVALNPAQLGGNLVVADVMPGRVSTQVLRRL
jgi:hypothetical protein